ncbi:MAG: putative membrane protein, partial [Gammaproteobacteria bacterium]
LSIMKLSLPELWSSLAEADLVSGTVAVEEESESPWYISLLMAFFGWLSAVFLIGFIAVGFSSILDSFAACITVGSALIVIAYLLFKAGKKEFLEYFALSISLVGQMLITYGIFDSNYDNSVAFWLSAAVIQMTLAVAMPSNVHQILSASFSGIAFSIALYLGGAQSLVNVSLMWTLCWLWLHEFQFLKVMSKMRCMGYGLVITLVVFKGFHVFESAQFLWGYRSGMDVWVPLWIGQILTGLAFLYVVWHLLNARFEKLNPSLLIAVLSTVGLIIAASFQASGIMVGMVILLLGFSASNRILMSLGSVSLIFYISDYYYLLDTTLLMKSATLLLVGLILLGSRYCLNRFSPFVNEVPGAN